MPGCFTGDRLCVTDIFKEDFRNGIRLSTSWKLTLSQDSIRAICIWLLSELNEDEMLANSIIYNEGFYLNSSNEDSVTAVSNIFLDMFDKGIYSDEEIYEYKSKKIRIEKNINTLKNALSEIQSIEPNLDSTSSRFSISSGKTHLIKALQNLEEEFKLHYKWHIESEIEK